MAFNDVENSGNDKSRNFLLYFIFPAVKLLAIFENWNMKMQISEIKADNISKFGNKSKIDLTDVNQFITFFHL